MQKLTKAFTLVEMLVVIAIIATLAALLFPMVQGMQERGKATSDLNNLRQIGLGTQMYLNDNDNSFFLSSKVWMTELNPKYVSAWKVFESPFDLRPTSNVAANAPVSYGINSKALDFSADKVVNPTAFLVYAPAQDGSNTVKFQGLGSANVKIDSKGQSNPGGTAKGGTHSNRKRINAIYNDWHIETMTWTTFINDQSTPTDPNAPQRWDPAATPAPSP